MLKKIGLIILILLVGFGLGWLSNMVYSGYYTARGMFLLQEADLCELGMAAEDAYFHQSPEIAVWALEHYCTAVEKVWEQRASATEDKKPFTLLTSDFDLIYAHTRLGKLYGQMGNAEKSQLHFDQALTHAKAANRKTIKTKEDCLRYLDAWDKTTSKQSESPAAGN
jgi:hypothetical protein